MIADEIKKAGQATIDQASDLLTYKITDTWTTYSGTYSGLAALACDTGGNYWYNGDYEEWKITFTQDVCRYNGTPVKYYTHNVWGSGDGSEYVVEDFSGNQLYQSESVKPDASNFTVRRLEFQNNKQSFQLLSSGQPSYTDEYDGSRYYSEAGLLTTDVVPSKYSCSSIYNRYLVTVARYEKRTLDKIYSADTCIMLMINAVQSDDYDWTSASYPATGGTVYAHITTYSGADVIHKEVWFNYYNPGNMMVVLQPNQIAEVYLRLNVSEEYNTKVLCTIQGVRL